MKDLHNNCVFDVATTGDKTFADAYILAQQLRLYGTAVEIESHEASSRPNRSRPEETMKLANPPDKSLIVIATVSPLTLGRPSSTGNVIFLLDGVPISRPIKLNQRGRAHFIIPRLKPGEHSIRAVYSGGGEYDYYSSSSPSLLYKVPREKDSDSDLGGWGRLKEHLGTGSDTTRQRS
jgi:hypothetical protein